MTPKQKRPGKAKTNLKPIGIVLLILALVVYFYLIFHFNFTQDDAYITFRYAANYLNGHGLVYDIGERVEGYTNFLWTIFMTVGGRAGIDFVLFSKILGVLFGLATIIMLYFLAIEVFAGVSKSTRSILAGTCCLLVGSIYSFAYWAVAGLETAAFGFMVLASIFFYLRRSLLVIPSVVLSLLFRPEGGLVFLFLFIYEIIRHRSLTRYAMITGVLFVIFLLPFGVFKLFYYKSLLPNPFYAKTSFDLQQAVNGLEYTGQFFWHYLGAGLFVVPALLTFRKSSSGQKLSMIFLLVYTLYIILIGGDVLKVHRFFVPLLPFAVLSVLFGFYAVSKRGLVIAPCLVVLLCWQLYFPYHYVTTFHNKENALAWKMNRLMDNLLAVDQSNFSIAVSTIGVVGYRLMDHTVIDLLGLTDSTIARHPEPPVKGMETTWRESHFNSRYVLSRQPDYILFSTGMRASAPAERALFLYSGFLNNYRTIPFLFGGYLNQVYKRYYAISLPVERDVSPEFEKQYNLGLTLWVKGDYRNALKALDRAIGFSPAPVYPYIYYCIALSYKELKDPTRGYLALQRLVRDDTLVVEAYCNLHLFEEYMGHTKAALACRSRVASLAPWYLPILDAEKNIR